MQPTLDAGQARFVRVAYARNMKKNLALLIVLAALASAPALAQHAQPSGDAVAARPYEFRTFGMFKKMLLEGDFTPKVQLNTAMMQRPTTGVGAVADARGEVTIYDGKLIVSYGKAEGRREPNADSASLLAVGTTKEWQSVNVERDVPQAEVEPYLAAAAKEHGINPEQPFPFQLRGTFGPYLMHVNAAPIDGPHGMGLPMAVTVVSEGERIEGGVAGVYVPSELMGVATHGGEHAHSHYVSPDGASTAHLDRWAIKAGTILMLPKP